MYILMMRTCWRDVNRIKKSQHLQTQSIITTYSTLIQQEVLHIYLPLNLEYGSSFMIWCNNANWAYASSFLRFLDHKSLHHTHAVGLFWTSDQLVAEAATCTTHNKHKRNSRAFNGIWTRDPTNQVAVDLCLRPHGYRGCVITEQKTRASFHFQRPEYSRKCL
jgi:hypothetical protein